MSTDKNKAIAGRTNRNTIPKRKKSYATFIFEPLHVNAGILELPVENLQISQNFSPNYNTEEVYGRMDPIVTFKNTKRSLNINFSCQSHQTFDGTRGPVSNILQVNRLTQCLYPSYHNIGEDSQLAVLKAPPFFRITYGNYIGSYNELGDILGNDSGLTGFITNFTHQLGAIAKNVAHGRWFARDPKGNNWPEPIRAIPREVKISFTFTVVHDRNVGWTNQNGNDIFSLGEYGQNFPYNVGNFAVEKAAMETVQAKIAQDKSKDLEKSSVTWESTKKEAATDSKKATAKAASSVGALKQVSQAQADAALAKGKAVGLTYKD